MEIIQLSGFNVGYLLKQRAEKYKEKIAFFVIKNGKISNISYSSLWKKVVEIGKGISSFNNRDLKPTIGLLTHNQLNGALVDLACLSFDSKLFPSPLILHPNMLLI